MIAVLPNILTASRMAALVPVTVLLVVAGPVERWAALGLFAAACLTDLLDGWLARRFDAQSTAGRILDPIADKVLVCGTILVLAAQSDAPVIASLVIIVRELMVAGMRETLAAHALSIAATPLSKGKTALQMAAVALLIVPPEAGLGTVAEIVFWLAALVTAVSGWRHWQAGWRALTAGRQSLSGGS